jgi:hypothetical protein
MVRLCHDNPLPGDDRHTVPAERTSVSFPFRAATLPGRPYRHPLRSGSGTGGGGPMPIATLAHQGRASACGLLDQAVAPADLLVVGDQR